MAGKMDVEIVALEMGGIYPRLRLLVEGGAGIYPNGIHVCLLGVQRSHRRQKQRQK